MQTVYDVQELAERWSLSPNSIRKMEVDGKLHRLPDMPGVKYSAAEVFQVENIGRHIEPLTPYERKRLEAEIATLKELVEKYERKMVEMMQIIQEVRHDN